MKLTYLGHSCVQIDAGVTDRPVRLVVDPGVFSPELPDGVDAVLLTHAHADHVVAAWVQVLAAGGARVIGDSSALDVLRESPDFTSEVILETAQAGETLDIAGVEVEAVGGRHAVIHADLPRDSNLGFLVRSGGTTLFHPGDTYEYTPAGVDVLAVPVVSPWGAPKEAVDFVRAVAPGVTIPIHDKLLAEGARGLFLGLITDLGGAPMHDTATKGPLEI